jgi:hypothetical protein
MELEPKSLNVPLHKRSWFPLQMALACMLVGWLWHKPTGIAEVLVSCLLGGIAAWLFLASPFVIKLGHHRIPLVRGATVIVAVVAYVAFMQNVVPYVLTLIK